MVLDVIDVNNILIVDELEKSIYLYTDVGARHPEIVMTKLAGIPEHCYIDHSVDAKILRHKYGFVYIAACLKEKDTNKFMGVGIWEFKDNRCIFKYRVGYKIDMGVIDVQAIITNNTLHDIKVVMKTEKHLMVKSCKVELRSKKYDEEYFKFEFS